MPSIIDQGDVLMLRLKDGRTLAFPATAKISRAHGRFRVNGQGYQVAMASTAIREIDHVVKDRHTPIVATNKAQTGDSPKGTLLPNACAHLDNCCSFNCGGGVGGCDASHQNCGTCPDCGGPIQSSLQDQLDCYYDAGGTCGNDSLGNPFGKLIMRFPGQGGYGGITCLWDISDQAYANGNDLNCMDDEPNILNAPFNGNVAVSYTWSRSQGKTTLVCGAASPSYVTQALFAYAETEGNIRLTAEKVVRNILPGMGLTVIFSPSLGVASATNGTYTYRAVALRIAAFCSSAGAIPVP